MRRIRKRLLIPMLWGALIFFILNAPGLKVEAAGEQTILDIEKGDISIDKDKISGYDSNGKLITTANINGYCIMQSNSSTKTSKVITVKNGSVDITLQGVNIDTSKCAFSIKSGASVNLTLVGINTLSSGGYGGLEVPEEAALVIDGKGSLTASSHSGAGIGGGNGNCGMVTIKSGTITATGTYGAGIGGGLQGTGGVVTITGGTVNATGTSNGAGIGGGFVASGGEVIITGGTVIANGDGAGIGGGINGNGGKVKILGGTVIAKSNYSAGIGGGDGEGTNRKGGHGADVFISGGNVTATGSDGGAGIGGGYKGNGGKVTILGGIVTATGNGGGASIGGGALGDGAQVKITGGTVIPINKDPDGKIIGGGRNGQAGTTIITGDCVKSSQIDRIQGIVTDETLHVVRPIYINYPMFSPGDIVNFRLNNGSCIQRKLTYDYPLYVWCPIETMNRITMWDDVWAADGMSFYVDSEGYVKYNGKKDFQSVTLQVMTRLFLSKSNIIISDDPKEFYGLNEADKKPPLNPGGYIIIPDDPKDPTVIKNTITIKDGSHNILICDLKAHPDSGSPLTINSGAEAYITLVGKNTLIGETGSAGIQLTKTTNQTVSKVFINGNGTLNAIGGTGGAGIGGSEGNTNGEITISGGSINATGGIGGAGIGSGSGNTNASECEIKILGGIINATGKGGGAGIGGGDSKGDTNKGSGNKVFITGGTVNAMGSNGGAGIGGGNSSISTSNETKIIGGSVHASSITGQVINEDGKELQPATITVPDITAPTLVNNLSINEILYCYGTTDTYVDASGMIFLWIPGNSSFIHADLIVNSKLYQNYYLYIIRASISKPNVFRMDPSPVKGLKSTYTYGDDINPVVTGSAGPYQYLGNDAITGTRYYSSTPPTNIGDYACITYLTNSYYAGIQNPFTIKPKDISSSYVLTFDKGTIYEYTGKAITPSIMVKDAGGKILDPMNYNVSFSNNVNCALATDTTPPTVTITGKGNYGGSIIAHFTIKSIQSTVKAITEFSVASCVGVIDESSHKITVTVPYGTNIANLIAQFTQTGLSIKVGTVEQVSGKTPNNFTNPVIYTVTAEDGSEQDYTVTVTVAEEKDVTFAEVTSLITKAQGYMTNGITYTTASLQALTTAITSACKLTKDSGQDIINNSAAELICAINKLVISTAGITLATEPSNSGTLVGAGNYVTGNIVTITAKPVSGYKFLGWYTGTDVTGTAFTTVSSFTYTIQETDTNVIFTAKYESNAEQKLSVKIGSGSVDYSYNSMSGTWDTDVLNQAFRKGTYITVSAKTNGATFLYWLNADTNRVVSNQINYSFNISEDMSLIACYKTTADTHMVIFKDMNGRILKTEEVIDGGASSAPEPGYFSGYTFSGWDKDYLVIKTDLTVTAQYVKVGEYVLTVSGGAIAVSGGAIEIDPQTYEKGDFVTVIADESKDGKYFSGWYNGDMLVSGKKQFSFYITENTFLTAKYEGGTLLHEQPIVTMTMSGRTILSNGKQSILSTVRWSVPQDYEVLSVGVIFTFNDTYQNSLTLENVSKNAELYKRPSLLKSTEGTYDYTLTLGSSYQSKNVHMIGYITYQNKDTGEITTIYSDRCDN